LTLSSLQHLSSINLHTPQSPSFCSPSLSNLLFSSLYTSKALSIHLFRVSTNMRCFSFSVFVSQDVTSRLSQTHRTEGNTSGCLPAIIRMTPRQRKVKGNSVSPPQSPLSASKAEVSLERWEIPLGFPPPQEIHRGFPWTIQSPRTIQITPGIAQEIPRDPRSDPTKMWPGHFWATTANRTPSHPAILGIDPGSLTPWQGGLNALVPVPISQKAYLPLEQQRHP